MNEHLQAIKTAVVNGKHLEIEDLVKKSLDQNIDLNDIINDSLIAAMDVVGQKFSRSEIFVPEMLVSAVSMKKGLDLIKPLLGAGKAEFKGTILMGTVKGDLHDIGKNLVIMILEGAGFKVIDLGVDLSVEKVVQQVQKVKPDILGLSALLTTTMPEMRNVIEALEHNGLRNSVKVIVGGAPIDAAFAKKIGSDGYGQDATEAVHLAEELCFIIVITRNNHLGGWGVQLKTDYSVIPLPGGTKGKGCEKMYNKILVPVDGSELAECVLPHIEKIVTDCGVKEIVFLRVIEPMVAALAGGDFIMGKDESQALQNQQEKAARNYLDKLIGSLPYDTVTLSGEVIKGKAAENIADFAANQELDLVIMATHGRSGVSRWVMGSVAERVIRWSCVPVLIVRPPQCAPAL